MRRQLKATKKVCGSEVIDHKRRGLWFRGTVRRKEDHC